MCASCAASDVSGKVSCDRKVGMNANGIRIGLDWIGLGRIHSKSVHFMQICIRYTIKSI